jgi:hypothetical protein
MKKIILPVLLLSTSVGATTVNGFDASFYGFIKASGMYASQALASYNNINLSAPTHAVAVTRPIDKTSRMSFQTQQTRAGINLKKGDNLSAKLEFDFIDFNKSSPTTQMNPRVRIAAVTYAWENNKIIVGQDWDLFSPVTSFTFDYVGLYFLAGNTGFMRQQAQYLKDLGQWELGGALGMAGNNPGVTDADLELAKSPSYSGRATYKINEKSRIGLSGIYARLNYQASPTANGTTHDAYAGNAFYEQAWDGLTVKSELYYGQNLANIGALSIGKGTDTRDVKEYGGMLTAHYRIMERNFIFGGGGFAKVDNRSQIPAFAPNPANTAITNPGIRQNIVTRVGWEYRITDDFSWISEVSRFQTVSKLSDNKYQHNIAGSFESGVQLRF